SGTTRWSREGLVLREFLFAECGRGVRGRRASAADSRSPANELRRARRFERRRSALRAQGLRRLCLGPPCHRAQGGRLLVRRSRSTKSANPLPKRNGRAPRLREALAASQCAERREFSCSLRAPHRVRGAVQQRFLKAPCRPCGRWRHHRAKQTPVPERTSREQTGATTLLRKGRRSCRQQSRSPLDPEESSGQDANQPSRLAYPMDELCEFWACDESYRAWPLVSCR